MLAFVIDINECDNRYKNNCSYYGSCFNTNGDYYCECNEGFKGSGYNCEGMFLYNCELKAYVSYSVCFLFMHHLSHSSNNCTEVKSQNITKKK